MATGVALASCWPAAAVSASATLGLAGLAWQTLALETNSPWLTAALGLAAAVLPLWLGSQLRRQSKAVVDQSHRLQALGRSEELLRLAEQVARLGSFDWDPTSGALHWSDEHYRLWGHTPGAVQPDYAAFRARIHPDDLDALEASLQHALRTGGIYEFKHRVCWPDGTLREVLARGDVTRDANGRALRMVGTVQDITHRRAAERRLQMHEFVLNTIADPVSVVDEHRAYLLVNQAWCRATQLGPDEVLGQTLAVLLPRVASAERDAAVLRCLKGGQTEVVLAALDLAGSGPGWWETTMFPFTDPHGGQRGAVLISRDVTARQAAARALATSLDNLRLTLNATGDAIFASDAAGPHEPLLFVNHRMLQMWDIPPEQAVGLTPAGVMAAASAFFVDPAHEHARVAEVIASGTVQEDRLALNDGRVLLRRCIPTQQAGRQVRVWGFRDITTEAHALAGLRTAEAQQRALLAAFPGYIACISADQRVTYANARLAELLESTPQALTGQPVAEAIGADGSASGASSGRRLARCIARVLDGALLSFEQVHPATTSRPEVHVLVTLARGLDHQSGQTQCYAFGIDITALKHTEAALLAAKNEAERANQAKSAFLNHMSHELRTPLHSVLGFARLLYDGAQPPLAPQQRAQLGEILQAGQDLMTLINGLFELALNDGAGATPPPPPPPPLAPPPATPPATPPAPPPATPPATPPVAPAPQTPAASDPLTDQEGLPLRVLYIDDNPVNTLLMAAMFERLPGLLLRCESDPHQGLALALSDPPALLLVDIQMPGLDGYQLLQRVRADPLACGVPAIAVSANAMPQDLARGRAAGFVDYLTKPLDLQRLQAALQAVLPGWSAPG